MRVGFFGGTFDPPHKGHLAVARAAADRFALDKVLMAPVGLQPLKQEHGPSASFEDRLQMVRLTAAHDVRLEASDVDAPLTGQKPNYTLDTLTLLHAMLGAETQLFAIIGADSFRQFARWHKPLQLLEKAEWIVAARPGEEFSSGWGALEADFPEAELAPVRHRIHFLTEPDQDISATQLRHELQRGVVSSEWLLPEVAAYIREQQLYRV